MPRPYTSEERLARAYLDIMDLMETAPDSKTCAGCKEDKLTTEFYPSTVNRNKDGLDYYCKLCRNSNSINSQLTKTKKCSVDGCTKNNYSKKMCRVHYERYRRNGSIHRKNEISVLKPYRLKEITHRYHIDLDWYKANVMGPCQICKEKPYQAPLHIEHDHACCGGAGSCGKCVRGLVCASCNTHIRHWDKGTIRKDNVYYDDIKQYIESYEQRRAA